MILEKIDFTSFADYLYMERYINDGSPSGFSYKYSTSAETSPLSKSKSFSLVSLEIPTSITIKDYGIKPSFLKCDFLIHPDFIEDILFSKCKIVEKEALLVSPTSSARTIKIIKDNYGFIKLNYKGLIGRVDRQLAKKHALSAIEVSEIIEEALRKRKLPNKFLFYKETFARVIELPNGEETYEWGMLYREEMPFPYDNKVSYIIPAFSLFSEDINNKNHKTLLTQIIEMQKKDVEEFLFEDLICPIYENYFELLINCGLQLEAHAQNTLIGIDKNFKITGIIFKDAESIDKDVSLMKELNIDNIIKSLDYKCLRRTDYNYQIMHSFMFDFKLGEYLISPIIEESYNNFNFNKKRLEEKIRFFNKKFISRLPEDFFPSNKWYFYEKVIHDRTKKRPYKFKENPKYR